MNEFGSCSMDFLVCFVVSETSNLYLYPFQLTFQFIGVWVLKQKFSLVNTKFKKIFLDH
jgi:hypothetical protein